MKSILIELYANLTETYKELIQDLYNGYPLKESNVSKLWELIQLIDCVKSGELSYEEYIKSLRRYA